jgi:hypothetical protein
VDGSPAVYPVYAPLAVYRVYVLLADAKAQAASRQAAAPADARDVATRPSLSPDDARRAPRDAAHPNHQASRASLPAGIRVVKPAGDPAPGQPPR